MPTTSQSHRSHAKPVFTHLALARGRLLVFGVALIALAGCDQIQQLIGGNQGLPEGVQEQIKKGDYPGAHQVLQVKAAEDPTNVDVAIHLAFTQMLSGDFKGADKTLSNAEAAAPPELVGGIKLRRALVGLRAGDIDSVKTHAEASGLPEGKLLAAEVYIADLKADSARPLLQSISNDPGVVGKTAKEYLAMLDGDSYLEAVAEITALWALGDRKTACEHAAEVIPDLDDTYEKKVELQILWASRAVTSGQVAVANALLADLTELPSQDLAWRVEATKAIIMVAEGRYEDGLKRFALLQEGGAPADGLADARATAAAVSQDPEVARQLVGDLESPAVSRGLLNAGASDDAKRAAPAGTVMKTFLEKK